MRKYETIRKLREGLIVDIEGITLKKIEGEIEKGDLYVAERNTGPKLLTAREVVWRTDGYIDFVVPTTADYAFDGYECVRVCEA